MYSEQVQQRGGRGIYKPALFFVIRRRLKATANQLVSHSVILIEVLEVFDLKRDQQVFPLSLFLSRLAKRWRSVELEFIVHGKQDIHVIIYTY